MHTCLTLDKPEAKSHHKATNFPAVSLRTAEGGGKTTLRKALCLCVFVVNTFAFCW
jgi:hypothetical protein